MGKVDSPYSVTYQENLHVGGMWFGVAPRTDTKKMSLKESAVSA